MSLISSTSELNSRSGSGLNEPRLIVDLNEFFSMCFYVVKAKSNNQSSFTASRRILSSTLELTGDALYSSGGGFLTTGSATACFLFLL
jgi:hypothetical protein